MSCQYTHIETSQNPLVRRFLGMKRLLLLGILTVGSVVAQPAAPTQFLVRLDRVDKNVSLGTMGEEGRRIGTEHMAYWNALVREGKLVLGGQAVDENDMFGILVINAANRQAAAEIVDRDPLIKAKVFRGTVIPFRTVFKPASDSAEARH